MERLRYVAGARGLDPAVLVAETVDALLDLSPGAGELVTLCRQLVRGHPTCAPMWWVCSRLLAEASALDDIDIDHLLGDVDALRHDATSYRLATALPGHETVVVGGSDVGPVAAGLAHDGSVHVLVIDAGDDADDLGRRLDRRGVSHEFVDALSTMAAVERASVAIVEVVAASPEVVLAPLGGGLLVAAAAATQTPTWLVIGRGCRLPTTYVRRIAATADAGHPRPTEAVPLVGDMVVVGPEGMNDDLATALRSECPETPELLAP